MLFIRGRMTYARASLSTPTHQEPGAPPSTRDSDPGSPAGTRSLTRFVTAVFTAWNSIDLPFVVLRNHEGLPEQVDNDLDLLVSPDRLQMAEQVLAAAARDAGYELHNRAEFGPLCLFFHHQTTLEQIQVDLFTSVAWRLLHLLPAEAVLERRVPGPLFAIPDPVDEAIVNLLTRLLYHGRIKDKYKPGVKAAFEAAPEAARERLAWSFPDAEAAFLTEAVLQQNWDGIEQRALALRGHVRSANLRRRPGALLASALRDVRRLLRRGLRPPGLCIAVLGPDGCGKSTVIPGLIDGLRFTFSPGKGLLLHWKPVVFGKKRRQSTGIVTNPHGKPSRNPFASLVYFGFHCLEFLLGTLTEIQPVKFRNGLVISDRCYYDFLVDPKRFRLKLPRWLLALGGRLLPQPDLVFLLDAPTEVLQSRKQEVPPAETQRQRDAFLAVLKALPNGHVLDATRAPEAVATEAVRIILNHLARRLRPTP